MEQPRDRTGITPPTIVIIGAGNVATHLCGALSHICTIEQVWSRNITHAQQLAQNAGTAQAISDLAQVKSHADYYLIAVPDNAIADIARQLPEVHGIVAHTSGSVNMQALSTCKCAGSGVFYPLQTFSRAKSVDFNEIPFFIEGDNADTTAALCRLAGMLSKSVHLADSQQRASLHIAAVFACNFANHLWSISADLLKEAGYDFNILHPLLTETLNKASEITPTAAQTGPAKRGDMNVINAHLSRLNGNEKKLYELITNMIIAKQHE